VSRLKHSSYYYTVS